MGLHGVRMGLYGATRGLHGVTRGLHGVTRGLYGVTRGLHGVRRGLHGVTMGLHGVTATGRCVPLGLRSMTGCEAAVSHLGDGCAVVGGCKNSAARNQHGGAGSDDFSGVVELYATID